MQKNLSRERRYSRPAVPEIIFRTMRITVFLLLTCMLKLHATSYSQGKLTMNLKHAKLSKVFNLVQKQTDYQFLYNNEDLQKAPPVTINVKDASVSDVLQLCFRNSALNYKIQNRVIIVTPASTAPVTKVVFPQPVKVSGTVTDTSGNPLVGVSVKVQGTTNGAITDGQGHFELEAEPDATLVLSYVGYTPLNVPLAQKTNLQNVRIRLKENSSELSQVVVVGYGTQKKKDITGAISSVSSKDIDKVHGGSTVSTSLAGKIAGVSFRQSEGRPGASAGIQIRNMGTPLFVIDGVVKDEGQFNNLSPQDIESITVLKDASAAIYGVRAANGVVVVTTKRGALNQKPHLSIDAYTGWQNPTRYPNNVLTSGYLWNLAAADAEMNQNGSTNITQDELDKWKAGTAYGYQSFDWPDFIFQKNAPQTSLNASVSGGDSTTNYYFSVTRLNQDAYFKEYNFNRTNIQTNIDTRVGERLKVGIDVNGRVEERVNPGVPGGDDYWEPLFSSLRNTPMEHPYANNNPKYLNDIGHNAENAGLWTYQNSGKWQSDWRVLQTNFHAQYDLPVKGLTAKAVYSYYYANNYLTNHEFTYKAYTYDPTDSSYNWTGGSSNPWQERGRTLINETDLQGQLNYGNTFGKHTIGATFVTEWYKRRTLYSWQHDVPAVNELDRILFNTIDNSSGYSDNNDPEARIGYIGQFTYNYADKYYLEFSAREDGSFLFPPNHRWGFFPSFSAGWRITQEPFFKSWVGGNNSVLSDLKLRVSYGKLGDDRNPDNSYVVAPFSYVPGYNYPAGTVILDGTAVTAASDRGEPVTNISWLTSNITDVGADFSLWNGSVTGSLDYFYRKRSGLLASKNDVLIPSELGYTLPAENLNSDAQVGGEGAISYNHSKGDFSYSIGFNLSYSRSKFLHSYKPKFGNSWDKYRNSSEERWTGIFWGQQVIGQFQSQEQINNYPVNIDGQGNRTLLPGDFIYKDANGDGVIDGYDERPIGYNTGNPPDLYGGLDFTLSWKGFDFTSDFSFGGLYSYNRNWEARWPFQNGGNLLNAYLDRWHRQDLFDLNSKWIPGKYPPLRFNDRGHSDYNKNSTWWLVNVKYFRARTLELGYTLPAKWTQKVKVERARFYVNAYDLFSIDNLKKNAGFLDPEISADNGLQYPQSKFVNVGVNLTF